MKPDKIYLGIEELDSGYIYNLSLDNNGHSEYIRKEALLECVKDRLAQYDPEYTNAGKELQMIIDKINSL